MPSLAWGLHPCSSSHGFIQKLWLSLSFCCCALQTAPALDTGDLQPFLRTSNPRWASLLAPFPVPLSYRGEEFQLFCCRLQAGSAAPRKLLLSGKELRVPLSLPPG